MPTRPKRRHSKGTSKAGQSRAPKAPRLRPKSARVTTPPELPRQSPVAQPVQTEGITRHIWIDFGLPIEAVGEITLHSAPLARALGTLLQRAAGAPRGRLPAAEEEQATAQSRRLFASLHEVTRSWLERDADRVMNSWVHALLTWEIFGHILTADQVLDLLNPLASDVLLALSVPGIGKHINDIRLSGTPVQRARLQRIMKRALPASQGGLPCRAINAKTHTSLLPLTRRRPASRADLRSNRNGRLEPPLIRVFLFGPGWSVWSTIRPSATYY